MKNKIKKGIAILLIGSLLTLIYMIIVKSNHKQEVARSMQTIPTFCLKNMDGSNFTQDSLMSGKATIFLYFNTDCDFCQNEIKSIREYMNLFRKASLILISPEPIEDIIKFIDSNNLSTQDNIKFLQDPILDFASKFDATIIPYTIVYNKDKQLIKRSKGQIKAEVILNLLNNEN